MVMLMLEQTLAIGISYKYRPPRIVAKGHLIIRARVLHSQFTRYAANPLLPRWSVELSFSEGRVARVPGFTSAWVSNGKPGLSIVTCFG
jgi:hypothetical protein